MYEKATSNFVNLSQNYINLPLKTHFGLHISLLTLSSLEIRNSWFLMPILHVGACSGVTELDIS